MANPCTCVRTVLRILDPSGNEREEFPVNTPGWTCITQVLPAPRSYDHQDGCMARHNKPVMIDIEAFKKLPGLSRTHEGNGTYKGPFAFTLTKSPKDSQTVADMIGAMKKLFRQNKSVKVKQFAWNLEYGSTDEAGLPAHPHIHGMYETESGGRIEQKHFKRAWKLWNEDDKKGLGFRGGYHRPVRVQEKYSDYIAKDGGVGDSSEQI